MARETVSDASEERASSVSLLPVYLRDVVRNDMLDRERELSLARDLQQARRRTVELARGLVRTDRDLFARVAPVDTEPEGWSSREAEEFCDRLAKHRDAFRPAEVARCKRRLLKAREALTVANLRLVVHIAQRYPSPALPILDRIQEGNIGLMRAVDLFDPEKGNRFSTYAVWWIRQSIARAIADKERLIRLPAHHHEKRRRMAKARRTLFQSLGREATVKELARKLEWSVKEVQQVIDTVPDPTSLDQMQDDRPRDNPIDRIADPNASKVVTLVGRNEAVAAIEKRMKEKLTTREIRILRLRFGLGSARSHTLKEVGRRINLSRERTRQIEAVAMAKLRACDELADLLGNLGGA